jgi:hypothetical protein
LGAAAICAVCLAASAATFSTPAQAAPTPVPVATVRPVQPTPVPPRPQTVATPIPALRPALTSPVPAAVTTNSTLPQPTFTPRIVYATVTPTPARSAQAAAGNPGVNPQWRPAEVPPPAPLGPATATPVLPTPVATRSTRPLTPVVSRQVMQPQISGKAPLSFTPTGNAGGGGKAPATPLINQALMYFGILSLSAAGSWGVYYLVRPPKD